MEPLKADQQQIDVQLAKQKSQLEYASYFANHPGGQLD